ncbi:MAG: hypothetical protein QXD66_00665 [Candidatus Nezhaarchaeales archaeon]
MRRKFMGAFDDNRRALLLIGMVAIAVIALMSFLIASALTPQQQQVVPEFRGVKVLEAYTNPSSVKVGEPALLIVRVSNNLNHNAEVKVFISIKGEVEKYVTVSGFNVVKISEGVWRWDFGVLPPLSEVKYVANLVFNIPSGIAEIKYRIYVDVVANGSTVDSRTFVIAVSD